MRFLAFARSLVILSSVPIPERLFPPNITQRHTFRIKGRAFISASSCATVTLPTPTPGSKCSNTQYYEIALPLTVPPGPGILSHALVAMTQLPFELLWPTVCRPLTTASNVRLPLLGDSSVPFDLGYALIL